MTKEILKVKGLSKKFQYNNKDIIVLKNLNFSIKEGELIALTGPSGSGKSTLLHIISLIEKPTSGKVFFLQKNVNDLKSREIDEIRKFKISLIFQNNNLISDLDVAENVMLPLLIRNEDPKKSRYSTCRSNKSCYRTKSSYCIKYRSCIISSIISCCGTC